MKTLILIVLMATGCATTSYQLTDTKDRNQAQHVIDDRECSKYHYDAGNRFLDTQYYYACMEVKGYKLEAQK